jgi:dsRNA-specific ribonuclease
MSALLYQRFAASDEGDLSRVRARLVRQDSLHQVALQLELPRCLRLGEGEARSGGAQRASILADALEALVGAVYLDAGFPAALAACSAARRELPSPCADTPSASTLQRTTNTCWCACPRVSTMA